MATKKNDIIVKLEDCMSKFGEAHNLLAKTDLHMDKYKPISALLSKAKIELFNVYNELKNSEGVS